MSLRQKSLRAAIALVSIIAISAVTFAASWTGVLHYVPFLSESSSENTLAVTQPASELRDANGRRLDMGENSALGTLSGTYNIPGDYADLAAAIADLNTSGVSGAVTFNVIAGNPQTSPAGGYVVGGVGSLVLTTTSAVNTVTIQGNGNTVTAPTTHTLGALNDGVFKLIGADWITISGFSIQENAANTDTTAGTNNMTEWGVALLYVSITDGAQNNTIQGNTIDLNRTYQNTFGIYSNSTHSATAVSTTINSTGGLAGTNSGTKIYANTITDVNQGIVIVGSANSANEHNDGIEVGGTAPNGNTITNFGTTGTFSSYVNVSGTVNGVLIRNSKNVTVSNNTITSSVGGVTAGTLNGIQFPAFSNAPSGTFTQNVNNNSISLQAGAAGSAMNGINILGTSASATSIINVNNNNFSNFGHTVAGTAAITFITQAGTHLTQSISNNTFTNMTVNTTGSVTFISNSQTLPASGLKNVNNNSIVTGFSKTGAGGTVTFFTDNGSDPATATNNTNGNNFSNVTLTGGTTLAGISNTNGGSPVKNVNNNTITNITGGTAATTAMTINFDAGTTTSTGNIISNVSGGAAVTGILLGTSSGTPGVTNLSQNTVNTLSSTSTSLVSGIVVGGSTGTRNVFRNKVYDISNSSAGTGFAVQGIQVSSGTTVNVFNNLIGDLRMPNGVGADLVRGINVTSATATSNVNVSFNTVYMNASTVSATSGTSALFHTISTVATTGTLNLRSNILVNTSTPAGSGATVAYRRSAGAANNLANYGSVSNNNLFYAGAPGPSNLIYSDGTSTAQSIANYKSGVFTAGTIAPRDSNSVSENPPFLSTTGANANFLHISAVTPTQIESGAIPVSGITDDFDGNARNVSTPDIGADEFAGTLLDVNPPTIVYTPFGNTTLTTNRTLNPTITDPSGVASSGLSPRIYFRKNGGSYNSTPCINTYDCIVDYSAVGGATTGDVIDYFVVAQDTIGNVGANPSGGFAATDVNNVTSPPTTPNTYTILAPFPASVNVGTGETYTSLTNAGGLFEAMNAGVFTGNTVISITSDLAGELGTFALNQLAEDGVGGYTVLIKPSGAPRSITGSNASALIRLNAADRVRFDGSTAATFADDEPDSAVGGNPALRELTIQNTNTGTSAVVVSVGSNATNGAQNNTIKNVNILGQDPTTTLVGISLGGATPGTAASGPNNNNRVENCSIKRSIFGIYSAGLSAASQNTGTVITQNETSDVTGDRIRRVGILVFNDNGVQISENSLNGISTNESADGIGIGLGSQAMDTTTTTAGGISNAVIERNKINGVASLSTTGFSAAGITVAGTTGGANTIRNNMITGVTAPATSPDLVAGIYVVGAAGSSTRVYHNSVAMTGDRGAVASQMPSFAIAITGADPTVELKNNIFYTTQTASGGGVNAESYAIGMVASTFANLDSNYNVFYSAGANAGFFRSGSLGSAAGTDYANLAGWQAAVSDDANSQEIDPVFLNPVNDLHLDGATSPILGDGITGFATNDFDGDARDPVPDIGADEIFVGNPGVLSFTAPFTLSEGAGTAQIAVERTGGTDGAVSVNYQSSGSTATSGASCGAGVDFVAAAGTLNWANGEGGVKNIPVQICDDASVEPSEDFFLNMAAPTGGVIIGKPNPATYTITDNDAQPGSLQFSSATYSNNENGGTIVMTVTRTGGSDGAVSAQVTFADVTATGGANCAAGVDYINTALGVNFSNGDSAPKFLNVPMCNEALDEPNETMTATLGSPTGGAVIGSPASATLTIINDDTPPPTVQLSSATFADDETQTMFVGVTRTGNTTGTSSVTLATAGVTATGGASCSPGVDYITVSTSVPFAGGQTNAFVPVQLCGDANLDQGETFTITLSAPSGATIGTPSSATVTINDTASMFSNTTPIAVNGPTVIPYPSTINVSGGPAVIGRIRVTLYDVTYPVPDDLDVLLVGPGGQKFILMADAGGAAPLATPTTLTFYDQANLLLPDSTPLTSGSYEPTSWELGQLSFPAPAPIAPYIEPGNILNGPFSLGTVFGGTSADGAWSLYVRDDNPAALPANEFGIATGILGGWGIELLIPTAANSTVSGRIADASGAGLSNVIVTIQGGPLAEPISTRSNTFGNYSFEGLPTGHVYIVTASSRRFIFNTPTRVVTVNDNVTGLDFTAATTQ